MGSGVEVRRLGAKSLTAEKKAKEQVGRKEEAVANDWSLAPAENPNPKPNPVRLEALGYPCPLCETFRVVEPRRTPLARTVGKDEGMEERKRGELTDRIKKG